MHPAPRASCLLGPGHPAHSSSFQRCPKAPAAALPTLVEKLRASALSRNLCAHRETSVLFPLERSFGVQSQSGGASAATLEFDLLCEATQALPCLLTMSCNGFSGLVPRRPRLHCRGCWAPTPSDQPNRAPEPLRLH